MSQVGICEIYNELSQLIHRIKNTFDNNTKDIHHSDVLKQITELDDAFYIDSEIYANRFVDSEAGGDELNTQERVFLQKDVENMEMAIEKLEKELGSYHGDESVKGAGGGQDNTVAQGKERCSGESIPSSTMPDKTISKESFKTLNDKQTKFDKGKEKKENIVKSNSSFYNDEDDEDIFNITTIEEVNMMEDDGETDNKNYENTDNKNDKENNNNNFKETDKNKSNNHDGNKSINFTENHDLSNRSNNIKLNYPALINTNNLCKEKSSTDVINTVISNKNKELEKEINSNWYISVCGITDLRSLRQISRFTKMMSCDITPFLNCLSTHILVQAESYLSSTDFLEALVTHKHVLSFDWLLECVAKNSIVDYTSFILHTPKNNINHNTPANNELLSNYQVFCLAQSAIYKDSLERLVEMCGGHVVFDPTLFLSRSTRQPIILLASNNFEPLLEHEYNRAKKAVSFRKCCVVLVQWLFDLIINNNNNTNKSNNENNNKPNNNVNKSNKHSNNNIKSIYSLDLTKYLTEIPTSKNSF